MLLPVLYFLSELIDVYRDRNVVLIALLTY